MPTYSSLADLISKAKDFKDDVSPTWPYNESPTKETAAFYEQWSNYLSSIPQVFAYFLNLPGWITKSLYSISMALENVYNNLFKLFGFFDYLDRNDTFVGQIFDGLQKLGVVVFVLLLILFIIANFITGLMKYKDVIGHFLLVTAVLAFLPQAIKEFSYVLAKDSQYISKMSDDGESGFASLSVKPYEGNVVDLYVIIQKNFDVNVLGMDKRGFLNPPSDSENKVRLNTIDDSNVMQTDYSAWYGGTDKTVLEQFEKDGDGGDANFKGVAPILSSVLRSNEEGNVRIDNVKPGTWSELENVFSAVYPRYSVNWIGLIVQQIVLIALLISMSIRFVQSVFQVIVAGMVAPIVGYTSVENSEKFKELLQMIFGTITGVFFEVILLRVAMSVLRDFPGMVASSFTWLSSGGFSSNLSYWENVMASIIVYIGVYLSLISGNNAVERWLGVSPSQGRGGQMAGMAGAGLAAGGAASRAGRKMVKSAPGVAKRTARGVGTVAKKASQGARSAARGAGTAAKGIGAGAARVAGGAKGAVEGIRQAGGVGRAAANLGSHAKAGVGSAYESVKSSVQSTAGGVKDSVKSAGQKVGDAAKSNYNAGRTGVANTLASGANANGKTNTSTKNEASGVGSTAANTNKPNQTKQGIGGASGSQISSNNSKTKTSSAPSNNGGIKKKDSGKKP
ncbi:pLS20_p028 family conjugation system transmembrane protein [Streptococcus panodentis]|uniref:Beta-carotene 15,15'-monooxygenase n=1 Tax=Streptococcus panodentis TaxID=1581472 RepID=A0ABS5AW29_9STRE|nr:MULTISPECIES: beta-carotene 15,15'-monooxygenase [Streptococcus]KXT83149.1 hypothetical protein STRDD11_01657 [Streptococcus sp. DD11]MBP2620471.1 beta-carotene 15,15'-monooxygenase [Streptococcus panodentis]